MARSYLSLKFCLASTLLANSSVFAEEKDLQVCRPYLTYYTLLNCCRSFLFTLPCEPWKWLTTIEANHSNIINKTSDKFKRLGKRHSDFMLSTLQSAKNQRELFSYRFPSTGLSLFGNDLISIDAAISTSRLLVELTQINLSCLEGRISRHRSKKFGIADVEEIWHLMQYEGHKCDYIDDEDYYRVGRWIRNRQQPTSLKGIASEGLVEDFFGAWVDPAKQDGFDADKDWNTLIDMW